MQMAIVAVMTSIKNSICKGANVINEAETIGSVIKKFRAILPQGHIYVYDNNSSDQTLQAAVEQGVHVRHEKRQGKGYVVNRMFADVEADFVMKSTNLTIAGDSPMRP